MKDEQCKLLPKRPTPLHYVAGMLALTLVCCCLLGFYFYKTPAYASSGYQQATGKTMTGQVAFETETETPPRTPTQTPTSTVTSTPTPIPSPSVTQTSTPVPTSTRAATATTYPSTTGKQSSSPVHMSVSTAGQETGGNQTSITTTAAPNDQGNQLHRSGNQTGESFPMSPLTISLGSGVLLGSLVTASWLFLRRRKRSRRSQKWSPGEAVARSRAPANDLYHSIVSQRTFDLATSRGGVLPSDQRDQAVQYGAVYQNLAFSEDDKDMSDTDLRATIQSFLY